MGSLKASGAQVDNAEGEVDLLQRFEQFEDQISQIVLDFKIMAVRRMKQIKDGINNDAYLSRDKTDEFIELSIRLAKAAKIHTLFGNARKILTEPEVNDADYFETVVKIERLVEELPLPDGMSNSSEDDEEVAIGEDSEIGEDRGKVSSYVRRTLDES